MRFRKIQISEVHEAQIIEGDSIRSVVSVFLERKNRPPANLLLLEAASCR